MRLEIEIEDEQPEAKILEQISDPGAYVLELVRMDNGQSAKHSNGLIAYEEIFSQGQNCPSAFKTREEVDKYVNELRSEW